jgi:hypothetical protein
VVNVASYFNTLVELVNYDLVIAFNQSFAVSKDSTVVWLLLGDWINIAHITFAADPQWKA